jgi:class 3 adenylate cyclase
VNLSQRLQQLASAGETVLSEATLRALTCEVATAALAEQLVKGRDTPVVAHKLLSYGQMSSGGKVVTTLARPPAARNIEGGPT